VAGNYAHDNGSFVRSVDGDDEIRRRRTTGQPTERNNMNLYELKMEFGISGQSDIKSATLFEALNDVEALEVITPSAHGARAVLKQFHTMVRLQLVTVIRVHPATWNGLAFHCRESDSVFGAAGSQCVGSLVELVEDAIAVSLESKGKDNDDTAG